MRVTRQEEEEEEGVEEMVEDSSRALPSTTPSDRRVEQAIVALKKGAQLLKYRHRGKPKFCPFRLSTDERLLIWYSGKDEKHLRLDSITKIIPGTVNFQKQPEPGMECQSFSIIYDNGELSLDLICKDKAQAESWLAGLRVLVSWSHLHKPFSTLRNYKGARSCINSPVGYSRRKHNLGLPENPTKFSQVRSLCGSPPRLLAESCHPDALSCSSDSFYSTGTGAFSRIRSVRSIVTPEPPSLESEDVEEQREISAIPDFQTGSLDEFWPSDGIPLAENTDVLRDVLMWGEGIEGGKLRGGDRISAPYDTQFDALLPKLLDSIALLDVKNICFGGKHAALVTRQGEVFCWGEENGGRLGHKTNVDLSYPKFVESLNGVHVESVSCGEYHTCAVTYDGDLYTWGGGGQTAGLGYLKHSQWLPKKVSGPFNNILVSSVACGEWHIAVVSSSGQLFTYGDGTFGVLGHGNAQSLSQAKEVESLKGLRVKSVACGTWHTAAVVDIMVDRSSEHSSSGKLFTWGDGDKGKLGHVDRESKFLPTCIAPLVDHDFVQVSCGTTLTVGLTSTGIVCTMGSAVHGQLGNPQAEDKSIAFVEGDLKGEFVKSISCGSYHVATLTSRGRVYTWGKGANGRLGLGDTKDRNSPTLVEALRDRQVESIACGSTLTAAICVHKSVYCGDQSGCSGCKMVFGFTRKKRNCYNCGFLFCRTCSSKKAVNASLAPNKGKPCHVCDACFIKLTKFSSSNRPIKHEDCHPRKSLIPRSGIAELKIDREVTLQQGALISPKIYNHEETKFTGGKTMQQLPFSSRPRWGQVQCPTLFSASAVTTVSPEHVPPGSKHRFPTLSTSVDGFSESHMMLNEEVQRLQVEAKSLEKQCQMKDERLQKYQERIEETWSLAREEAARCKAAKEIIKALTIRLYALSDKQSAPIEANLPTRTTDGLDMTLPQITTNTFNIEDTNPVLFTARLTSPIRDTLPNKVSEENVTKTTKAEWVEQDEPGVYITFTNLPNGQKGLKRVRFSRKRFSEKEAEIWWEENKLRVYDKHGVQGLLGQQKNKIRS